MKKNNYQHLSPLRCHAWNVLFSAGVLFSGFCFMTNSVLSASPKITIDAGEPGRKASQMLQGIFVEDWCHQVEGGIYGEMLRNRSFDDKASSKEADLDGFVMRLPDEASDKSAGDLVGWKLGTGKPGAVKWALDQSKPLNENNVIGLKLTVTDVSTKTGFYNEGLIDKGNKGKSTSRGIWVQKDASYVFSCFARSDDTSAGLEAIIEMPDGRKLVSAKIDGLTADWKKYEVTLKSPETVAGAHLFVAATAPGVYFLDMVSLFPQETWKGRPNGLRKDLMEMVSALKPAFVRFPGGCFVEGLSVGNAWHWKKTIGKVEERPGHWNIWGWRSSDGMGYFEYLQMCEDLGAEPLVVVFCGMAHSVKDGMQQEQMECVPMEKMPEIVQDALDAVEFANGPETSTWGAKRAAMGHPKPFNLKMVEIGNENHGPEYAERYPLFHDAFKAKYPEIQLVMNSWGPNNYPKNRTPDILDIHRFALPYWFADNYKMFDAYDRKGFKVYFGEWCANLELPDKESISAGVHEAAFIAGLEKNSDLVIMQSYAPFINNLGWSGRKPNMINFDVSRVYGTPVYWAQKMFADNITQTLVNFKGEIPEYRPVKKGYVGLGTTDAQAEFKDIKITTPNGSVFDSESDKNSYRFVKSGKKSWDNKPEALVQTDGGRQLAIINKEVSGDHTISLKARKTGGKNGFNIFFHTMPDGDNSRYWQLGGDNNKSSKIIGEGFVKDEIPKFSIENNKWYDLRVEIVGDNISCYVDNALTSKTHYGALQSLYTSVGKVDASNQMVIKVVNVTLEPQKAQIVSNGAQYESTGSATVLASKDPLDRNSLDNPSAILPKEVSVEKVSTDFEYEFPPSSFTVLRLKLK